MKKVKAILCLEDGVCFEGRAIGAVGETSGEVVFNTSMSGYQEILTDPSYAGQIVTMTYPLIGNYGVNAEDVESDKIQVKGFIVKELSRIVSNFRSEMSLQDYLQSNHIIGIEGIDTRALTRHLRSKGAMKGVISTEDLDSASLQKKAQQSPDMEGADWVKAVSTSKAYDYEAEGKALFKVAVIDCGIKRNILRIFSELGIHCRVFPATVSAEEILSYSPDGLFISNGPGDPAAVTYVIDTVKKLLGKLPIFGICLGHQILCLALGAKTFKLKFGHRGANHPVREEATGIVDISSQNHGFCVDPKTMTEDMKIAFMNLNDNTVAGLKHSTMPIFAIQYHPEASPGPRESKRLFQEFITMMQQRQKAHA